MKNLNLKFDFFCIKRNIKNFIVSHYKYSIYLIMLNNN